MGVNKKKSCLCEVLEKFLDQLNRIDVELTKHIADQHKKTRELHRKLDAVNRVIEGLDKSK